MLLYCFPDVLTTKRITFSIEKNKYDDYIKTSCNCPTIIISNRKSKYDRKQNNKKMFLFYNFSQQEVAQMIDFILLQHKRR